MRKYLNRVRVFASGSPGQGNITYGAAFSNAFLSPAESGIVSGDKFSYVIEEGTDFEIGYGTDISTTSFSRDTVIVSKISGAVGTTKMTVTSSAQIRFIAQGSDIGFDNLHVHGADIAAAATVNLETATGDLVDITYGSPDLAVTAITLSEGHSRVCRFTGITILTHGASLILPGSASITTQAGDIAIFRGYAGGVVRCVSFTRLGARGTYVYPITPSPGTPGDASLYNAFSANVNGGTFEVANWTGGIDGYYYAFWIKFTTAHSLSFGTKFKTTGYSPTATAGKYDHLMFRYDAAADVYALVGTRLNVET